MDYFRCYKKSDIAREKLRQKSKYLREVLKNLGYKIASESHIVSIESGTEENTEIMRDALEERGIFGSVFCSPATPKNKALIRFSVNSQLDQKNIDYIIKSCKDIRDSKKYKNLNITDLGNIKKKIQ